jgi:hypothetical protein
MPTSAQNSIRTIEQFLRQVGQIKTAEDDQPLSEPGSQGGETDHPSGEVDDRLQDVTTGERFDENTEDVNEDQGPPSVQNASEAKVGSANGAFNIFDLAARFARRPGGRQKTAEGEAVSVGGSAADDQMQIGTNVQPTGEDPKNETESAKAGKEDKREGGLGGTDHPASTENDELDGHKYALDSNTPLEQLARLMKEAGDTVCAQIAYLSQVQSAPYASYAGQQQKQAQIDPWLAQQAGWEMASLLSGNFDKQAADSLVVNTMYEIIKTASDDADRFICFMDNFLVGGAEKTATGEDPAQQAGAGNEIPPEVAAAIAAAADDNKPSTDESSSANDAAAEDALLDALSTGDSGEEGGDADDAEADQLVDVLEQLGVTPEELETAIAEEVANDMAAPDGGAAPAAAAAATEKPAADKSAQAQKRAGTKVAEMRNYIKEIVQRSRARRAAAA